MSGRHRQRGDDSCNDLGWRRTPSLSSTCLSWVPAVHMDVTNVDAMSSRQRPPANDAVSLASAAVICDQPGCIRERLVLRIADENDGAEAIWIAERPYKQLIGGAAGWLFDVHRAAASTVLQLARVTVANGP